jgi:RNA polymerase sigma-70 factor (ECF subfamily)
MAVGPRIRQSQQRFNVNAVSFTLPHMDEQTDLTDEALMEAFRDGDYAAFESLYQRHRAALLRFILRSVGNRAIAEELFQDIWIRLIDSKARYVPSARFQTYLYRITRNRIIDHYRALKPVDSLDDNDGHERLADTGSRSAETTIDLGNATLQLKKALCELPLDQRTAFLLQAERGMSLAEIAEISGVGRETIKSRLRYAVAKLRKALRDGVSHDPN